MLHLLSTSRSRFSRLRSPAVGSSRRSALKRGGQLTTAGWRGRAGPLGAACRAAEEQKVEDDVQAFMR